MNLTSSETPNLESNEGINNPRFELSDGRISLDNTPTLTPNEEDESIPSFIVSKNADTPNNESDSDSPCILLFL